ncbi:Gluconeogenesis factor [Nonomuraea coxensis DSM 45129]|uniref:Gluconeogenesis factor n=1 Tax=Nonomuraea coxensis DSM 45129 TaxID=1122611 RepID=A0ABX8U6E8_9ACTN|nr:2-phospho-L-lactate transferase CofD family protein [Nonomuraea coxensis]QYC43264.1 Gluconeogenesis factor [Nonomuraea coxensis DSM 45129]
MRVALFSGGRGAAGIARALLRTPGLDLALLVNGYDNGLSTGALRRYLPGMLGPSDFRKNLLLHLGRDDPRRALLEHRLPPGSTLADLDRIAESLAASGTVGEPVVRDLRTFAARLAAGPGALDLADCALGNLVFAGAYLRLGGDFNAAVRSCARAFASPARLLNVTDGANAYLVALKQDGRVLADEADIVGPQDAAAITGLFLLPAPLTGPELAGLAGLPAERVRELLAGRAVPAAPNPEALRALADSDLVVYGPGTPHSSLLPSYLTQGVAEAIAGGRSTARVFVVNVGSDHDVQGLSATDLVDRALAYLGDPGNERRLITHVLSHDGPASGPAVPRAVAERGTWAGARWIAADLEDPCRPGAHHGPRTVAALRALLGETPLARAG